MKGKKSLILVVLIIIIILGICIFVAVKDSDKDAYKFKKEYESLNGTETESGKTIRNVVIDPDNSMKYSKAEEIVKKIENKETFVVYFGFAECPWCRSMIENLIDTAKKKNIDEIYYVDIQKIRDKKEIVDGEVKTTEEGDESYMKLLEYLGDVLDKYTLTDEDDNEVDTGEKRIYAPNLVAVVNGKPEKKQDGISPRLKNPYSKITKKMKNESIKEIECIFKCLEKENVCTTKTSC